MKLILLIVLIAVIAWAAYTYLYKGRRDRGRRY